jgi:hypothetical protein
VRSWCTGMYDACHALPQMCWCFAHAYLLL